MRQIENFQRNNGLVADNLLGPNTLKAMKSSFRITRNEQAAHFLGQMAHESGNFTRGRENLNYSAEGLLKTFGKYFSPDTIDPETKKVIPGTASQYARNTIMIGNRVYANRMGNGPEESGDGYHFRGAGPLQLTGERNIVAFSKHVNDPEVVKNPDLIVTKYYFTSALFFFDQNNLWKYCNTVDDASILKVSRAINIGNPFSTATPHGMKDRIEKTRKFYEYLRR